MLVGVAPLPSSFPHSGTLAFYFTNRPNSATICNTVYIPDLLLYYGMMIGKLNIVNYGDIEF